MPSCPSHITQKPRIHCLKSLTAAAFAMLFILTGNSGLQASDTPRTPGKFIITIDAGHGGKDSGAPGKKSKEKNIALAIALKLGHYLEGLMQDVDVFYTRKTDVFIPLYERAPIANRNKSDLFISIHVNAVEKRTAPIGTSTYVMGFSKSTDNLDLVMQENKAMLYENDYQTRYAGFDPTSAESYILSNNVQNNNLAQSLELAAAVQDQFRTKAQRKDMGVHQGNLVVLWGCTSPSILIETGFISNPQEEEFLMSENGQDIIASAIFTAVREYKELADSRINGLSKNIDTKSSTASNQQDITKKTADPVKKQPEPEKKPEAQRKQADTVTKPVIAEKKPAIVEKPVIQDKQSADKADKDAAVNQAAASPSGLEYRVQVLASGKKLAPGSSEFKGVKDLTEMNTDGMYKYLSKPVTDYEEALVLRRKLASTFKGAFIVVYRDGQRVPANQAADAKK